VCHRHHVLIYFSSAWDSLHVQWDTEAAEHVSPWEVELAAPAEPAAASAGNPAPAPAFSRTSRLFSGSHRTASRLRSDRSAKRRRHRRSRAYHREYNLARERGGLPEAGRHEPGARLLRGDRLPRRPRHHAAAREEPLLSVRERPSRCVSTNNSTIQALDESPLRN
jgi:hypothetical protein